MRSWICCCMSILLACSVISCAPSSTQPASDEASAAAPAIGEVFPDEEWQRAESPESLGWSSEKLAAAQAFADGIGSAAVMIVDDGIVVDSWGDVRINYHCHSMRKSLISALYGVYVDEGAIDLSNTLLELGIHDHTPLTQTESQATVADLLKARSGVYIRAVGEAASMVDARPERGSHDPGTFWYYNNWDFNALGTIFDQETGEESVYAAFQKRIAQPIGMQDYRPESLSYAYEPYTIHPYYGFRMSTRDLARFGLLFLREGNWNSEQIIPADWVQESTAAHTDNGGGGGYGYMWWTGTGFGLFPNVSVTGHNYFASGYRGHRVVVLPDYDLVIAHRVDTFRPEGEVSESEFGVLLWMILDAAGETDIGEAPFIDNASGTHLVGDELRSTIAGSRLLADSGSSGALVVNALDGSVSIFLGEQLVYTGLWWMENDRYCVDIPDSEDIGGCFHVLQDGTSFKLFEPNGILSMRFEILEEDR